LAALTFSEVYKITVVKLCKLTEQKLTRS